MQPTFEKLSISRTVVIVTGMVVVVSLVEVRSGISASSSPSEAGCGVGDKTAVTILWF